MEAKLALKPKKLHSTRHVLSGHGNKSSACFLFILGWDEKVRHQKGDEHHRRGAKLGCSVWIWIGANEGDGGAAYCAKASQGLIWIWIGIGICNIDVFGFFINWLLIGCSSYVRFIQLMFFIHGDNIRSINDYLFQWFLNFSIIIVICLYFWSINGKSFQK